MLLRPYQSKALEEIRDLFGADTRKVLLHLATGGGKTLIFCQVLKGAHQKGKRAIMVVRGKKLVDQASLRLDREGVDHGVIMAGHWRNRPTLPIQICSIDTLYSRRSKMPLEMVDLVVIDEAHNACSDSYKWLVSKFPTAFYLAVSATPHVKEGLRHVADEVVYPISLRELIAQGFLVPPEYWVPSKADLRGVEIDSKTGDYKTNQLSTAMQKANLYGDMVKAYKQHADGLPCLLFCVSVKHSESVREAFLQAGISCEHLDAKSSDQDRAVKIKNLETGRTKVLTNVGILTTGVDIPCVGCIILARPTKSYNLYIQILGRGTRPYPGKHKFIVLDHANAIEEHGFIENERECSLDGKPIGKIYNLGIAVSICKNCFFAFDPSPASVGQKRDYICPECSHDNSPASILERIVDESYELVKVESQRIGESPIQFEIRKLIDKAKSNGYKPGWVYYKIREKFNEHQAKENFQFIKKVYAGEK